MDLVLLPVPALVRVPVVVQLPLLLVLGQPRPRGKQLVSVFSINPSTTRIVEGQIRPEIRPPSFLFTCVALLVFVCLSSKTNVQVGILGSSNNLNWLNSLSR